MATLETASLPLIIRRNPADPTDVVNELIQAGRMKSVRLADFIGQKSGQIRYVIRQVVTARGPSNAELLEKYAGRESFQNWGWLKQLHQNLEEAGQRGDNLENVVDAMRRAQGRFGAAEMAGFMALRAPELKALVLRLAAEKGSASSIWEAMKAVGSACHERGGGVCEVRGAKPLLDVQIADKDIRDAVLDGYQSKSDINPHYSTSPKGEAWSIGAYAADNKLSGPISKKRNVWSIGGNEFKLDESGQVYRYYAEGSGGYIQEHAEAVARGLRALSGESGPVPEVQIKKNVVHIPVKGYKRDGSEARALVRMEWNGRNVSLPNYAGTSTKKLNDPHIAAEAIQVGLEQTGGILLRKPTPKREYRYAAINRPDAPRGGRHVDSGKYRHGIYVYDRPLSVDDVNEWQLRPLLSKAETDDLIRFLLEERYSVLLRREDAEDEISEHPNELVTEDRIQSAQEQSKTWPGSGRYGVDPFGGWEHVVEDVWATIYSTHKQKYGEPVSKRREYRYAAVNRPPGFGSVPKGHIRIEPRQPGVSIARHGFVVYDRPLSKEEHESYELYPYKTVEEVAQMVRERMGDYQAEYMEQLREDPASLAEIMPERRYFSDLEGQALQDAVYRVLVPKKNPLKLRRNPDGGPRADIGCADEVVIDSEGRSYPIIYRVVEAALDGSTVVTSHNPQTFEWQTGAPLRYPEEFQTRDLGSAAESTKIERIAKNLEPLRLLGKHMDPTLGAPVVWPHGGKLFVLGGNGRAMAFLRAPEHAYQAYLKLARCRWDCFPSGAAPHGSRWMLVREVQDISKEQAIQLAAASQKSTAATENKIAEAIGLVRALGLEAAEMPLFRFNGPMTPENVEEMRRPTINAEGFREESPGFRFFEYVRRRLDPTKQSKVAQDLQEAARYMEAAVIGLLPEAAQKPSLYEDSRSQDALLGAAPAIISTHSWELHGKLLPGYDLWPALRDAVPLFETIRRKKPLDIRKQMDMEREQVGIQGGKRISDAPPLAWALALALRAAAGTSQPEVRVAELIRPYYEALQTACYKPEEDTGQAGMFGRMRAVVADPCEGRRKPAGDLFADSLRDSGVSGADAFYKNYYQIVHGEVPVGAARTLFNRGPARKLNDLLTVAHVYARHGDAPAIEWQRPLDTENAHEFRSLNPDFYRWALHKYPAERGWAGGVDALLGGMLSALPAALQTRLVSLPPRQHPLVIAALPSVLTLHQAAQRGEVAPAMDPGRSFPEAVLRATTVKEAIQAMRDYTDKARRSDPRQTALWNRGRSKRR